jgi:hypothetical protein
MAGCAARRISAKGSQPLAWISKDHLTVPEQRRKRSRHHRLRVAAGHHNDYIGAIDCGS